MPAYGPFTPAPRTLIPGKLTKPFPWKSSNHSVKSSGTRCSDGAPRKNKSMSIDKMIAGLAGNRGSGDRFDSTRSEDSESQYPLVNSVQASLPAVWRFRRKRQVDSRRYGQPTNPWRTGKGSLVRKWFSNTSSIETPSVSRFALGKGSQHETGDPVKPSGLLAGSLASGRSGKGRSPDIFQEKGRSLPRGGA